jgi:hypothetical protein
MVTSRGFGDSTVQARGQGFRSEVQFTRPADTNAYTALDVVGSATSAIHEFTQVGPRGGDLIVFAAELMINLAAVPSGMAGFRLHLYSSSPTAILDNAAFDLVAADRDVYMGYADFGTPEDLGSTLFSQARFVYAEAQLASAVTSLWGELQTIGAYTPASGTGYRVRLRTIEI